MSPTTLSGLSSCACPQQPYRHPADMTSAPQNVHAAVTSHAAEYTRLWYVRMLSPHTLRGPRVALILIAAGGGSARVPTCEHTLQHVTDEWRGHTQLVVRAVSLLGHGELPALRVADPTTFHTILDMERRQAAAAAKREAKSAARRLPADTKDRPALSQALDTLRAVTCSTVLLGTDSAPKVVKRCAATLKQLDCRLPEFCDRAAWTDALARCTQLESLTHARCYGPAAWLGLSHLHTLRGVDLRVVSFASIAAALPRLHTLEASLTGTPLGRKDPPAAVAGFFEDLLPRLRAFHFRGRWPRVENAPPVAPQPLPHLQELTWQCETDDPNVHRGFMGAQPVRLYSSAGVIADWLAATGDATVAKSSWRPLARARAVRFADSTSEVVVPPTPSDFARTLHAAPHLRTLTVLGLPEPPTWMTPRGPTDPEFIGLVHARLSTIVITHEGRPGSQPSTDCAVWLRQRHFPRLQLLISDGTDYFATPLGPQN